MENKSVHYECREEAGIITLNRPHRLNAINLDLLTSFIEALCLARDDHSARVILLMGQGKAFCAGEDLKETALGKDLDQWIREADLLQEVQRMTMKLGKPMIAAVQGYALGGGCEFAMGCDIRIVSEDAVFGFPETTVGMTVTNAGTKLLTHLVGLGKAKELIFTGDFINARQALTLGLANRVVPKEELLTETMAMARKLCQRSPLSLSLSRIAIDQGMEASFDQIMELERTHLLVCAQAGNDYAIKRLREMDTD